MDTYDDTAYKAFKEATTDALLDKEGYLVELGTAEGTVQLATSGNLSIGVLHQKQEGNPHVNVRLLGKGGTIKGVAGGSIAKGANVGWGTGGKFVTMATGNTLGKKIGHGTAANNDVVEILDCPRTIA